MGYFPNGTSAKLYEEHYCAHCAHNTEDRSCAVLDAHILCNYKEANRKDSILHILIPMADDGIGNRKCRMFIPRGTRHDGTLALSANDPESETAGQRADRLYREWDAARKKGDLYILLPAIFAL